MKYWRKCGVALFLAGPVIFTFIVLCVAQNPSKPGDYLALEQVWPTARIYLIVSGQRLRKAGQERMTALGTVSFDGAQPAAIQITWEVPLKVRIDNGGKTTIFDRNKPAQSLPSEQKTADAVESLLEDSLEGFFANAREGSSRFLGSGYRTKDAKPGAPAFEIVEVWSKSQLRDGQRVVRQYWFDSRTKLLHRVIHRTMRGGSFVEVVWSDWREVQGEKVPFKIERIEAGRTAIQVTLSSVLLSPKAADNAFGGE